MPGILSSNSRFCWRSGSWFLVDVLVKGFDQLFDGIVEPSEVLQDVVLDGIAGDAKTVAFLGAQGLQGLQAQHPRA